MTDVRLEDSFWNPPPPLPAGLALTRLERLVSRRPGPSGHAIDDLVELGWHGGRIRLLLAYKAPLLARDVSAAARRLRDALGERAFLVAEPSMILTVPALATDQAMPSVIRACASEGVALLDRRGTVIVRAPGVFVHVLGRGPARRVRDESPIRFLGIPARVVRVLLDDFSARRTARTIAERIGAAYAPVYEALVSLEKDGLVARESPRTGFRVRDPLGLLRAWIASKDKTAVSVEPYYAPDVTPRALSNSSRLFRREGIKGIWTLASGLRPEEVHVSGLPHGIYLSGSSGPLEEALGLRRITPHNFLILRAEPAAETDQGGIYFAPRSFDHGPAVALPQLAVDFAGIGGRGLEEAEFLVGAYATEVLRS